MQTESNRSIERSQFQPLASPPAAPNLQPALGAGPIGVDRRPVLVLLLSLVTFGIYFLYWLYKSIQEIQAHSQLPRITSSGWAVGLLLVPIVNIVWGVMLCWKLPGWVRAMEEQHGRGRLGVGLAFAMLLLLPPIGQWMIQSALNDHWALHRQPATFVG